MRRRRLTSKSHLDMIPRLSGLVTMDACHSCKTNERKTYTIRSQGFPSHLVFPQILSC